MALHKELLKRSLPSGLPPRGFLQPRSGGHHGRRKDYSPLPWSDFFDSHKDISTGTNSFRVYLKGSTGPVLLLLHGGGHSALSWAVFSVAVSEMVECRVAAMDIRGHGNTVTENDSDLSASTLSGDVQSVAQSLYGEESPPIVLMGHSMGGAIAVHVAAKLTIPSLVGLAVIDVVEGTAMESLGANHTFLSNRPSSFNSLEHAIEWSIRSGQLRNVQSARVSVPGQIIRYDGSGRSVCSESYKTDDSPAHERHTKPESLSQQTITEEESEAEGPEVETERRDGEGSERERREGEGSERERREGKGSERERREGEGNETESREGTTAVVTEQKKDEKTVKDTTSRETASKAVEKEVYVWRIDLAKTDAHWRGWFNGLTHLFLSCPLPKILILAGVDRLDKEMTIAHMQGKFQMQVLSGCGHAVHEDVPEKVAEIIAGYLVRHKFSEPKESFKRSLTGMPFIP